MSMQEIIFLFFTILIELPFAVLLLRKESWQRVVLIVASVNFITHPLGWYAVSQGFDWLMVEVLVTLIEVLILSILIRRPARAFVAALTMNVVSAIAGILFV